MEAVSPTFSSVLSFAFDYFANITRHRDRFATWTPALLLSLTSVRRLYKSSKSAKNTPISSSTSLSFAISALQPGTSKTWRRSGAVRARSQ